MKQNAAFVSLLFLSLSSAYTILGHPKNRVVGWGLPTTEQKKSTRLQYTHSENDATRAGVCEETLKSAITSTFHTKDGFTSEDMVWELAPLLPTHAKLNIEWIGNIARVEIIVPPSDNKNGSRKVFSTFLNGSKIEDMKTNIIMHYDEAHYNEY